MRFLSIIIVFFVSISAGNAQMQDTGTQDVIYIKSGSTLIGDIVEYVYEEKVIIVLDQGELKEIEWKNIRRIGFDQDRRPAQKESEPETGTEPEEQEEQASIPTRKWQHQVNLGGLFGAERSVRFGFPTTLRSIGSGANYLLVRNLGKLKVGGGFDFSILSFARQENSAALIGMAQMPLFGIRDRKVEVYARIIAGPALPVGSSSELSMITKRNLGFMYHPSMGIEFRTGRNDYGNLMLDLGYRFLNSSFEITNFTLDVLERNVSYRRFSLTLGYRL